MLTQIKFSTLKPAAKPLKLSDGAGLYLLVLPSGGKVLKKEKLEKIAATLNTFESVANEWHKLKAIDWSATTERKAREGIDH